MKGFYAAVQLMNRAGDNGYFVEFVCLATSVVDALLRTGLVLKHQLASKTNDIPTQFVYQGDDDRIIAERAIYKQALENNVIPQDQFDQLEDLYARRNKVVHTYIISEITTDQVLQIAIEYQQIIDAINAQIRKLEDEQIQLGVGMTVAENRSSSGLQTTDMSAVQWLVDEKHGNPNLAKNLKQPPGKNG
ncbi:MAG TPA: hypothetical protein VLX91_05725 [Candidatus Acidoferrales bacterium]|nr:hypothetical protein [Candidatus Acidoferrales bacterium]